MNKITYKLLIIFWLTFLPSIFASGGSVYTRYGVGNIFNSYSARRMGLGSIGTSLLGTGDLSPVNPASWSNLKVTRLSIGVGYNGINLNSGSTNAFYSTTDFSGFSIGFPVDKDLGISFVMGLLPFSRVEYEVNVNSTDNNLPSGKFTYDGNGSINKVYFGASYKLPFNLQFGATFEYYTGDINYSSTASFKEFSPFANARYTEDLQYRGFGTTLGLISSDISKVLNIKKLTNLRLGASLNLISNLRTDSSLITINKLGQINSLSTLLQTNIPYKLSFGASFNWNTDYLFLVDYIYQPWSQYDFNNIPDNNLRNLSVVSLGFEYKNSEARYTSFWEQIKYRGGLSFKQTQYYINGKGIDEYSVHVGVTAPLGPRSNIDIGLAYGIKGTNELNLIKENFVKANISLNFGELWFIRQER